MDRAAQLTVFQTASNNVRHLEAAIRQVRRTIHVALRRGDEPSEEAHTLVLALLYCAWLEALFVKITHTPYGFDLPELKAIRDRQDQFGIHEGWKRCLDLGLQRVAQGPKSNELPNIRLHVTRLIDEYVQEPAILRNKIAHGQWAVALNRERTATNTLVTTQIESLDVATLDRWLAVARHLSEIIEALIESPDKHFRGAYWTQVTALEERIQQMSPWTRQSRVDRLRRKPIHWRHKF